MSNLSHHRLKALLTGLCHHPQHTWQPQERALRGSESLRLLPRPPSSPLPNTKAKSKAVPIPLALDELNMKYDWMCSGRSLHYLAPWGMAPGWRSEHRGAEIRSTGAGHWLTLPIQDLQSQMTHQCYAKPSQFLMLRQLGLSPIPGAVPLCKRPIRFPYTASLPLLSVFKQ